MDRVRTFIHSHSDMIPYIFFGICTTAVNVASYWVLSYAFSQMILLSTALAWLIAVLFAYVTNRIWVFHSTARSRVEIVMELAAFLSCRILTGGIDMICMFALAECMRLNDLFVKFGANILVIALNYVASRAVIFKKRSVESQLPQMISQIIMKRRWSFLVFALWSLLALFSIRITGPAPAGDAKEYILQTISFQRHFSFGVTEQDLQQAMEEFPSISQQLSTEYYGNSHHMHPYGEARFSNHYGSYSAIVVPVKIVLDALSLNPLWAFPLTNYVLWGLALAVICFCLRALESQRFCLMLLCTVNPVFPYLHWIHSEVYLYAFTVIGLVFFYNRSYGRSIFFLSVAAMQNLALLAMAMIAGVALIIDKINAYQRCNTRFLVLDFLKQNTLAIIPYGLCYIPGILPLISTYARFHTVNLVKDVALENKYLLHKALDYLFDLNLGILPYETIILALFLIMLLTGVRKHCQASLLTAGGVVGMLYIVSHQQQINCGMTGMMRYNVWIFPVLLFYVTMCYGAFPLSGKHTRLLGASVMQTFITGAILAFMITGKGNFSYLEFAPWTAVLLDQHPELYNPSHGIFYSRALGYETYQSGDPVAYCSSDGSTRKILLSTGALNAFSTTDWVVTDKSGKELDKESLSSITIDQGDYRYINLPKNSYLAKRYVSGTTVFFDSEKANCESYLFNGFRERESWGSWTNGNRCMMRFSMEENVPCFHAKLDVNGAFYRPQRVQIYANDRCVWEDGVEGEQMIEFDFSAVDTNIVTIRIELPDAVRPCDVVDSYDARTLGIGLRSLTFTAAET